MSIYKLSAADQKLTADEQKQIAKLKSIWAEAQSKGDQTAAENAHKQAEAIRNAAGYSGGADGSGTIPVEKKTVGTTAGGASAAETEKWLKNYWTDNYNADRGWINGYSGEMNQRSMANHIRQQMDANSKAWHTADADTKSYLHEENKKLAKLIEDNVGGVKSTYDPATGQWYTKNANLGYGINVGQYHPGDIQDVYKDHYGMTDAQIEAYRNDTDRYYNFIDQDLVRNWVDERDGFSGKYGQYENGPYQMYLGHGTKGFYEPYLVDRDAIGDGFMDAYSLRPVRDDSGNIVPVDDFMKNNNGVSDYTNQFTSKIENGVIQPGILTQAHPGGGRGKTGGSASGGTGSGSRNDSLDRWKTAAEQQVTASHDYGVNRNVQALLQAQAEAEAQLQSQRDQTYRDERNALDNSALYAETRGDRGGIGKAQYNAIQAAALANRQAVNQAQIQLAASTNSQIADLRAQGEFEKADALLQIAQTYLEKLLDMEKWAAEFGLDQQKFQASVQQWQMEFAQKAGAALR